MAGHRTTEETGLSDLGTSNQHISHSVLDRINPSPTGFINQEGSAFDFGELEEALVLQGLGMNNHDEAKASLYTARPAATLEMFPSLPIRFHHNQRGSSKSGGRESSDSASAVNTRSELPISRKASWDHQAIVDWKYLQQHQAEMASDQSPTKGLSQSTQVAQPPAKRTPEKLHRKGAGTVSERVLDAKTLRRLAQNREAAKKSRLRKKAYVQQLEASRIKLAQLEQDLQRARAQGLLMGGGGGAFGGVSSGAAVFDMEYGRWLDEEHRHVSELRAGLQAHLPDGDLRIIVDGCIVHYDEIFRLKGVAAKSDVFHLITGMWATPAERCFLWMGGFRPSDLLKMLVSQLDPLTEQQVMGVYSLQHSTQQGEDALSQGLEQLQNSLADTISGSASAPVNDTMHHMALALAQLTNLEGFIRQADNLRQQTLHQLHRLLTVRQAARCFLVIGEYYGRLRALSSLWVSRPRESLIGDDSSCQTTTDLQMVQSSQNHFMNF